MRKVKLIKPHEDMVYTNLSIPMCFCSGISKEGTVHQVTQFNECREQVISYLRAQYEKDLGYNAAYIGYVAGNKNNPVRIDTERVRLFIKRSYGIPNKNNSRSAYFESCLDTSVRILNIFEHKLHWLRTTSYEVECASKGTMLYMVVGSKRWMRSPASLSLYMLLVRSAFSADIKLTAKHTTVDSIISLLGGLSNNDFSESEDFEWLTNKDNEKWYKFLHSMGEVFRGRGPREAFTLKKQLSLDYSDDESVDDNYVELDEEGIDVFMKGHTSDVECYEKWSKMSK